MTGKIVKPSKAKLMRHTKPIVFANRSQHTDFPKNEFTIKFKKDCNCLFFNYIFFLIFKIFLNS